MQSAGQNAARCGSFRQKLSVTQTTLMRAHGCSAVKTVCSRQRAALKSTAVGMQILKRADRQRKIASAKVKAAHAKVRKSQRMRKETLDTEIAYIAYQQVGAVALKHGIHDTTEERLKLYKLRGAMRVKARELVANRRAMLQSIDTQVKYQLEQGPLGDVQFDPTHKHVPMTTRPLSKDICRDREREKLLPCSRTSPVWLRRSRRLSSTSLPRLQQHRLLAVQPVL